MIASSFLVSAMTFMIPNAGFAKDVPTSQLQIIDEIGDISPNAPDFHAFTSVTYKEPNPNQTGQTTCERGSQTVDCFVQVQGKTLSRSRYEYDAKGHLAKIRYFYDFYQTGTLKEDSFSVYQYSDAGAIIAVQKFDFDGETAELKMSFRYEYDAAGRMSVMYDEVAAGIRVDRRTFFSYNADGSLGSTVMHSMILGEDVVTATGQYVRQGNTYTVMNDEMDGTHLWSHYFSRYTLDAAGRNTHFEYFRSYHGEPWALAKDTVLTYDGEKVSTIRTVKDISPLHPSGGYQINSVLRYDAKGRITSIENRGFDSSAYPTNFKEALTYEYFD